jgi:hypothetical protein
LHWIICSFGGINLAVAVIVYNTSASIARFIVDLQIKIYFYRFITALRSELPREPKGYTFIVAS